MTAATTRSATASGDRALPGILNGTFRQNLVLTAPGRTADTAGRTPD
ncbi:MAG: hypothetical protein WAW03_14750 [Anaerolineae bacterium]